MNVTLSKPGKFFWGVKPVSQFPSGDLSSSFQKQLHERKFPHAS